ncbi:Ig-like domain-containing protein [Vibrio rotiferianus]|uniref:Ig-like domain-containing protein n=1 Tax=Vibrio rotiferianus TaxID=190895 RepID=UPI00406A8257
MNLFNSTNVLSFVSGLALRAKGKVAVSVAALLSISTFSAFAGDMLPTKGEQKTLVLLVNFQENPNDQPISIAQAESLVFGEINNFYREASFEQTWLSGEVAGWFTLPLSNQVCDFTAVQNAADDKAVAAGVPLANYDRIIYLMTKTACGVAGSATLQGIPSRAHINGDFSATNITHELGHNFGLHHSRALDCGDETLGSQCEIREYGDTYDVMGGPDIGYFNTFQREQLGWLDGEHSSKTIEVTQDGNYSIANYEVQSDQPITLKVPRGLDSTTGMMRWFYIEYRQSVGFDDFLDGRSYSFYRGDVTDGIIIRSATDGDARSSSLLHFKTDSEYKAVFGRNDWFDPAMPVAGTYTDPDSGVTMTLNSAANGMAEVNIHFGNPGNGGDDKVCTTHMPILKATATTDSSVYAGESVQYQVAVTNQDSADCANTTFSVNATVPSGWQATNGQLTLAPGESGQLLLTVTSASNATAKDYSIGMTALHSQDSSASATGAVTYTVIEEVGTIPELSAVNDSVVLTQKQPVTIDVLANDVIDEETKASIVSYTSPSKGRVELLSDGTFRYTPEKRFKNTDSFSYTISDGQSSSTAWVSITLQESSDGGGNGSKPGKGNNK